MRAFAHPALTLQIFPNLCTIRRKSKKDIAPRFQTAPQSGHSDGKQELCPFFSSAKIHVFYDRACGLILLSFKELSIIPPSVKFVHDSAYNFINLSGYKESDSKQFPEHSQLKRQSSLLFGGAGRKHLHCRLNLRIIFRCQCPGCNGGADLVAHFYCNVRLEAHSDQAFPLRRKILSSRKSHS